MELLLKKGGGKRVRGRENQERRKETRGRGSKRKRKSEHVEQEKVGEGGQGGVLFSCDMLVVRADAECDGGDGKVSWRSMTCDDLDDFELVTGHA